MLRRIWFFIGPLALSENFTYRQLIITAGGVIRNFFFSSNSRFSHQSQSIHLLEAKMSSLYKQSIPVMIKQLNSMSKILNKTVAYADENGLKPDEVLAFRLREDMRP
jgi:hypothetical protein